MTNSLYLLLPWFFGASLCCAFFSRSTFTNREQNLPLSYWAGVGGLLGTLIFSFAILQAGRNGLSILSSKLSLLLALLTLIGLAKLITKTSQERIPQFKKIDLALALLLIPYCYTLISQAQSLPVFAWDSVDHWFFRAERLILELDEGNTKLLREYDRHPNTVVAIGAWAGWAARNIGSNSTLFWLVPLISSYLILNGHLKLLTQSPWLPRIGGIILLSIPLLEAHTLAAGYAEIWLSSIVLASVSLAGIHFSTERRTFLFLAILMALCAIAIKNIGIVYFAGLGVAFCAAFFGASSRLSAPLLIVLSLAIGFGVHQGFDINLASIRVAWSPEQLKLVLGGYNLFLTLHPFKSIVGNQIFAWSVNLSFSLLLFAFLASGFRLLTRDQAIRIKNPSKDEKSLLVVLFGAFSVIVITTLAQMIVPAAFANALPASDISNSRFSLPAVGPMLLFVMLSAAKITEDARK